MGNSSTPKKKAALPNKLPNAIKEKILKMTKKIEKKENIMKALKKSKLASSAKMTLMYARERSLRMTIYGQSKKITFLEIKNDNQSRKIKKLEDISKIMRTLIDKQYETIKMLKNKCKKESRRKPSASKKM